jgi:hypothetical protein
MNRIYMMKIINLFATRPGSIDTFYVDLRILLILSAFIP